MNSLDSKQPLEKKYIERILAIYTRAGDEALATRIVNSVSSEITTTIRNNKGREINEDLFTDTLDHIEDQSIKERHPRIMLILEEFVKAKALEILNMERDQTPNTKLAKEETVEDILNHIRKLKLLIEKHISEIRYNKETISEMEGTLDKINPSVLETIRGITDELKAEFESNVETIQEALNQINNKKDILIEKHKFKQKIIDIKLPQDEIEEIRQIINNIYATLNDKLSSFDPTKTIHKKKLIDEYIEIMENMFEGDDKLVAIGTIEFMNNYITNIISSEKSNSEKREFLRHNLFKAINTGYLDNNEKAIRMLKLISIIKINELLKEKENEDEVHTISYVPEKIKLIVLMKFKEILKKFGDNEVLNKKICNNFIINLDEVTPKLLQFIVEKKSIDDFKVAYIIPILEKLKIPAEAHDDFMEIVDMYHINSKETIRELSIDEKRETNSQNNNHLQAHVHLKNAFDKCNNIQDINTCNLVSQYVLNNIFGKISINIAAIIQDNKQKTETSRDPLDIVRRMHNLRKISQEQALPMEQTGVIDLENPKIKSFCQSYIKEFLSTFLVPNRIKRDLELFIHFYYYYSIGILIQNKETGNKLYTQAKNKLTK